MAALDEVNAEGDAASGFLWRLQTEDGNATAVKAFGWDVAGSHGVIVSLTTWQSVEALAGFAFSGWHLEIMRQRRQWFHRVAEATTALWWVPSGHRPSTNEAEEPGAATAPTRAFRRQLHVAQALPGLRAGSRGRALKRRLALPGLTGGPSSHSSIPERALDMRSCGSGDRISSAVARGTRRRGSTGVPALDMQISLRERPRHGDVGRDAG